MATMTEIITILTITMILAQSAVRLLRTLLITITRIIAIAIQQQYYTTKIYTPPSINIRSV